MTHRENILRKFTIGDLENPITFSSIQFALLLADAEDMIEELRHEMDLVLSNSYIEPGPKYYA